jgi:ribosomal protein S25
LNVMLLRSRRRGGYESFKQERAGQGQEGNYFNKKDWKDGKVPLEEQLVGIVDECVETVRDEGEAGKNEKGTRRARRASEIRARVCTKANDGIGAFQGITF